MAEEAAKSFSSVVTHDDASENKFESRSGSEVSSEDEENVSSLSKNNEQSDIKIALLPPNQRTEDDIHDEPLGTYDNIPALEPPRKISVTDQEDTWTLLG